MSDSHRLPGSRPARPTARVGFGPLVLPGEVLQHVLLIVGFAALLRLPYFGNPAIYIDEQFYLLVADRWLHEGVIPYLGIWDRKPIGIFLIYAAGQLFRDPIIGYQTIALLCVIGTALLLWAMAARVWDRTVGLYAALLYCASIMLLDGQGGQAPVFYNLPVAAAAYLLLGFAVERDRRDRAGAALTAAMLFGVALQIKYAVVFEASALSIFGLVALARRRAWPLRHIVPLALGMMILGIAPTAIVGAAYAAIGHWNDFLFANFLSILAKDSWRQSLSLYIAQYWRVSSRALQVLLPTVALGIEFAVTRPQLNARERWMFSGLVTWLAATFAGAMVMGKPAEHYFLPTLMPLSIFTAIALHRLFTLGHIERLLPRWPRRIDALAIFAALAGVTSVASFATVADTEDHWGTPALIASAGAAVKERLHGRCLYVFNRLPILYYLSQGCMTTRYPFPNHLNDSSELHALPDDALTEFARVLATKPVLVVRIPITAETDPAAEEMLNRVLTRDYVLDQMIEGDKQTINIYVPR